VPYGTIYDRETAVHCPYCPLCYVDGRRQWLYLCLWRDVVWRCLVCSNAYFEATPEQEAVLRLGGEQALPAELASYVGRMIGLPR
jgi:hypothetical protein